MTLSFTRGAAVLALAAALLAGCATGYRLDNAVQSFSSLQALPANPTYRFEWLPSQRGRPEQAQLEALADGPLFQAGLRRDDASPRYTVQLDVSVQRILSPWADPWYGGWGWGLGLGTYHRGLGVGIGVGEPLWPRAEPPWWRRELRVLVRELASNQVVYESRVVNEGPWADGSAVLSAMLHSAMQGFPNPPAGVRRVEVQVGGGR